MNTQISKISEIMEDIKQDITNNQYKIIMDNLMIIQQTTFYMKTIIETISFLYVNGQMKNQKLLIVIMIVLEEMIYMDIYQFTSLMMNIMKILIL